MKTTAFFTTSLLIYMAEAYQLHLPDELVRHRRSPNAKPLNISQIEFETKMREYQRMTRGTEQQREYEPIAPIETQTQTNGDVVLKFSSPRFTNAEDILLKILVDSATHVSVHQTMQNGEEIEIKSKDLPSSPLWVDSHLKITPELVVRISCSPGCQIQYPTVNVQNEILQAARTGQDEYIPRRRICPKEVNSYTPCCLTESRVKFQELEPEGLDHLFAPVFYDASFCGRFDCGRSTQNHYSFIKRIVTRKDSSQLPATECSPNLYKPLTVLSVHPDNEDLLVVSIWDQAIAVRCGCF